MTIEVEFLKSNPYFSGLNPTEFDSVNPFIFEKKDMRIIEAKNLETSFNRMMKDEIESKSICRVDYENPNYILSGKVGDIYQAKKYSTASTVVSTLGGVGLLAGIPYTVIAHLKQGESIHKNISIGVLSAGAVLTIMGAILPREIASGLQMHVEIVSTEEKKIVWKKTFSSQKEILGASVPGAVQEVEMIYRNVISQMIWAMNMSLVKKSNSNKRSKLNYMDEKKANSNKKL